jgi:hypothetical protein
MPPARKYLHAPGPETDMSAAKAKAVARLIDTKRALSAVEIPTAGKKSGKRRWGSWLFFVRKRNVASLGRLRVLIDSLGSMCLRNEALVRNFATLVDCGLNRTE